MNSEDKKAYIIANYSNSSTKRLQEVTGCSTGTIYRIVNVYGLRKSEDYFRKINSERDIRIAKTQFKKGSTPLNKGLKQSEYMSAKSIAKTTATRFRKGQSSHNHKPVGSERTTVDGYVEIKTEEPNVWRLKHRVVWEQHNEQLSRNMIVSFKDGNRGNCEITNLELITKKENMSRNTFHNYPENIKEVIRLKTSLKKQIKKRKRL